MQVPFLIFAATLAAAQSAPHVNVFRTNDLKIVDGPHVEAVGDKTAVIAWSTDVESSATIRYGINPNNLDQKAEEKWGGNKAGGSVVHRITVKNLKPATKYWFAVESGEGWHRSKAIARSETRNFTTLAPGYKSAAPKTAAPLTRPATIVAGPLAANVTNNSANIWWMAGQSLSGSIAYGTAADALSESVPFRDKNFVELASLKPNTLYYFQLRNGAGQAITNGSFTTADPDFAQVKFKITRGPTIEVVGQESVTVSWSTNARSGSTVRFGPNPANLDRTAMAPWGQREHRVVIRGLKPGTRYYFQVESAQAEGSGLAAKSNVAPFQTVTETQSALRNPDWQR